MRPHRRVGVSNKSVIAEGFCRQSSTSFVVAVVGQALPDNAPPEHPNYSLNVAQSLVPMGLLALQLRLFLIIAKVMS